MTAIRVPADFEDEFPGASRTSAELAANLVRTCDAFLTEVQRRRKRIVDLSASAFQALAVLEGADGPLAPHVIAERLLVSSASMTSLLDTLQRRGLVRREAHPTDRRKVLITMTDEARDIVDQMLPVVHGTATEAMADLTDREREQVIGALAMIRGRLAELSGRQPATPQPRRRPRKGRGRRRGSAPQ